MPVLSAIPNKTSTCVSIDREKRDECVRKGINISLVLDAALERELNLPCKEAFTHAMERQNKTYKDFLSELDLKSKFEEWKYKDVVAKKPEQTNGQIARSLEGVG